MNVERSGRGDSRIHWVRVLLRIRRNYSSRILQLAEFRSRIIQRLQLWS